MSNEVSTVGSSLMPSTICSGDVRARDRVGGLRVGNQFRQILSNYLYSFRDSHERDLGVVACRQNESKIMQLALSCNYSATLGRRESCDGHESNNN